MNDDRRKATASWLAWDGPVEMSATAVVMSVREIAGRMLQRRRRRVSASSVDD